MAAMLRPCLLLGILMTTFTLVQSKPRMARQTEGGEEYPEVMTQFGRLRGKRVNASEETFVDVFLGIPYAKPPVGDLRLAKPEPPVSWPGTRDATVHGAQCVQRIIVGDPVLENVPYKEDCLFLDIYTARNKDDTQTKQPTMVFFHGGGFYGGSGAKYNFTNVALRGVTVVSVSFRLDVFGLLSTLDDVIPGNFALLDQIQSLDWIKENIDVFGGDPEDITIFGASSGGVMVSILKMSPLAKGKFQKAIMQSGVVHCAWGLRTKDSDYGNPRVLAKQLGERLNCSLPQTNFSTELLTCLRATPVDVLASESVALQEETYQGDMIFTPVVETTFGVLPDTPSNLIAQSTDLMNIPSIIGYTKDDGSWLVYDPDNNGVTLDEFKLFVRGGIQRSYPPSERNKVYEKAIATYLPEDPSKLTPSEIRERLVQVFTDASQAACAVYEAREIYKSVKDPKLYVFQFNHRPSYFQGPGWLGVTHASEKGFVLGLPLGPDPFKYPVHDEDDEVVADIVVTAWTNFAKHGDPTPAPTEWGEWPEFIPHESEKIMLIQKNPKMQEFDRDEGVKVWMGESSTHGGNYGSNCRCCSLLVFYLAALMVVWERLF